MQTAADVYQQIEKRLRSPQVARGCGRVKMHTKSMSLSKTPSKVDSLDPIFANRCRRIPTNRSLSPPRRPWPPASSLRPLASQPPASSRWPPSLHPLESHVWGAP